MCSLKLNFSYEESVGDSTLISFYIKVNFKDKDMQKIVDVDGLFSVINKQGFLPLFTCDCGNFSCGGYYIKVIHLEDGILFDNSYKPVNEPDETQLIETFEYKLSWIDLYNIASAVYAQINLINNKYPGFNICSGAYSDIVLKNIDEYQRLLKEFKDKCG